MVIARFLNSQNPATIERILRDAEFLDRQFAQFALRSRLDWRLLHQFQQPFFNDPPIAIRFLVQLFVGQYYWRELWFVHLLRCDWIMT